MWTKGGQVALRATRSSGPATVAQHIPSDDDRLCPKQVLAGVRLAEAEFKKMEVGKATELFKHTQACTNIVQAQEMPRLPMVALNIHHGDKGAQAQLFAPPPALWMSRQ